jgi:hypothetical protein
MAEAGPIAGIDEEIEEVAAPFADDTDAVDELFRRRAGKHRAIEGHSVPLSGDPGEDLMHVDLRTSSERIPDILPVDQ